MTSSTMIACSSWIRTLPKLRLHLRFSRKIKKIKVSPCIQSRQVKILLNYPKETKVGLTLMTLYCWKFIKAIKSKESQTIISQAISWSLMTVLPSLKISQILKLKHIKSERWKMHKKLQRKKQEIMKMKTHKNFKLMSLSLMLTSTNT